MTRFLISRNTLAALAFAFTCAALLQMKIDVPLSLAQVQAVLQKDDLAVQEGARCDASSSKEVQFVGCTGFF